MHWPCVWGNFSVTRPFLIIQLLRHKPGLVLHDKPHIYCFILYHPGSSAGIVLQERVLVALAKPCSLFFNLLTTPRGSSHNEILPQFLPFQYFIQSLQNRSELLFVQISTNYHEITLRCLRSPQLRRVPPGYLFSISKWCRGLWIVYHTCVLRGLRFPALWSQE